MTIVRTVCNNLSKLMLSLALLPGVCSVATAANQVCAPAANAAANASSVGKPFTVRGRLSAWNGAPTHRIWIIGTTRILGVHGGSTMPDNLLAFTQSFDVEVVGNFVVCPVTKSHPGVMQMVRIVSASKLRPQPRATE